MNAENQNGNTHQSKGLTRHAYCIMAHNEPEILRTLVRMIDDERNDIFIHIDAKADMSQFADIRTKKSKLVWTPRVKTYWGGPSMIEATYVVFEAARKNGDYGYYHHLSGSDLPVRTQDEVHEFCDVAHKGKEFLAFWLGNEQRDDFKEQWQYYHVFDDLRMSKNAIKRKAASVVRRLAMLVQKKLGIRRKFKMDIMAGCQYGSYTQAFIDYLLAHRDEALKMSRFMHVPDEKVIHSLLWASPFREKLFYYDPPEGNGARKIKPGPPNLWKIGDLKELSETPCLFARKFSSADMEIVRAVEKMIEERAGLGAGS